MGIRGKLQSRLKEAKEGKDVDGKISGYGDAYISYETEEIGGIRYLKFWVGVPNEDIGAGPPKQVTESIADILREFPEADFAPESGEMYATIEI